MQVQELLVNVLCVVENQFDKSVIISVARYLHILKFIHTLSMCSIQMYVHFKIQRSILF